jgi:hypothetical protein
VALVIQQLKSEFKKRLNPYGLEISGSHGGKSEA